MRAPLSFPISRDSLPFHVYFSGDLHLVHGDTFWHSTTEYIIMLLQMIRHKALIVRRIPEPLYHYHGGAIKVLYPEPVTKEYNLEDLESMLGEHIARLYMRALSKYYTELPKSRRTIIKGQKGWRILDKYIDIIHGKSNGGDRWMVSCLDYCEEAGCVEMCITKREAQSGKWTDTYGFDLSNGDEYIEEIGMSVYDIFVQVCAWLFADERRSWHLMRALNDKLYESGWEIFVSGVTTAKLADSKDRSKRIHDGRHVRFKTKGRFMVDASLPRSSIFLLVKQVDASELLVNIGRASCASFHGDGWNVVASIGQGRLALGIAKSGFRREVDEYIYVPAEKYLSDRFIILPQLKHLYCYITRKISFGLSIKYEQGEESDKVMVKRMHTLDIGQLSTIAYPLWRTIKDSLIRL